MNEKISLSELERIKNALHEEILRRDRIIEGLKKENELLLKTALKRSEALSELQKGVIGALGDKNVKTAKSKRKA